nr:hypothetical protein [Desulfobaculum xiamenense]
MPVDPLVAYFMGMVLLVIGCTVVGELSLAGAYHLNRRHFAAINMEMVHQHNLSVQAIGMKDKASYKACNSLANEAFGRNFFSHIALFASSLWPVPFVLGWMSFRFSEVEFPLPFTVPAVGDTVGNSFFFIPLYIVARVAFAKARPHLPLFSRLHKAMKDNENQERLISWAELGKPGAMPGVASDVTCGVMPGDAARIQRS